ncbi:DUF488 domain-containing protein [Salinithrix halophila]|uniref:DUF488 domain-containing protein n=1 Tax=Salinithrix halophila TaxID=1485204 RepID=A0ABV8JE39_9BACL
MSDFIRIKRVYEKADEQDGFRVLVDRLWPRGLSKEDAQIDWWAKDLAPSDKLRKRFHKDRDFEVFAKDYRQELTVENAVRLFKKAGNHRVITLLYASKDQQQNNARVLRDFLDECQSDRE